MVRSLRVSARRLGYGGEDVGKIEGWVVRNAMAQRDEAYRGVRSITCEGCGSCGASQWCFRRAKSAADTGRKERLLIGLTWPYRPRLPHDQLRPLARPATIP